MIKKISATKKLIFTFIIIILSTSLVGCNLTSEEDKKEAKKIVNDYSKAFKKRSCTKTVV